MEFGSNTFTHEDCCSQGHSSAPTIATIDAALSADQDIDNSAIIVRMIGPVVILEGYVAKPSDREKTISLAAMIVGHEHVHDRMLARLTT
jgi:osmotically-inducible protein OsmY